MDFYESIAKYYQDIFPLNPMQIQFVGNSHKKNASQICLLDIGCAIGDLSMELSKKYHSVIGIDLDEGMVKKAQEKARDIPNLRFKKGNMLELVNDYSTHRFDLITCFGNTLVHLPSEEQVLEFFQQAYQTLHPDGKLLVQIINYDRIIDQEVDHLPTIENEKIRFIRNYYYQKDTNKVDFETILSSKTSSEEIKNCIPLLALRKNKIEELLLRCGFRSIHFYGNFKRESLQPNSMPLIFEASKI